MSGGGPCFLAEFTGPERLVAALRVAARAGHRGLDAFTPMPVAGLDTLLDTRRSRIRPAMLAAGLGAAAFACLLQWWSAAIDYPLNTGGRPLQSWPVFLLVPFEVAVLAAGIAGFVAFLAACGLPRLHHPLFEVPGIERATQDRYFLLAQSRTGADGLALRHLLDDAGAVSVNEVRA